MAQAATSLEPRQFIDGAVSSNLRVVFGSRRKLEELSRAVVEEFRADILRIAGSNLATVTPANVDSLCNAWMQAQERYKNRSAALTTFKTALGNTVTYFAHEHSTELLEELQKLVAQCDEELHQRNQVDETILNRKTILQGWIEELKEYTDSYHAPAPDKKPRTRKRTRKSAKK